MQAANLSAAAARSWIGGFLLAVVFGADEPPQPPTSSASAAARMNGRRVDITQLYAPASASPVTAGEPGSRRVGRGRVGEAGLVARQACASNGTSWTICAGLTELG